MFNETHLNPSAFPEIDEEIQDEEIEDGSNPIETENEEEVIIDDNSPEKIDDNNNEEEEEEEEEEEDEEDEDNNGDLAEEAEPDIDYIYSPPPDATRQIDIELYKINKKKSSHPTLKAPNLRRSNVKTTLADYQPLQLDIRSFPTHQYMSAFFYDSWHNIERINVYYDQKARFSISVEIQENPALIHLSRYSRNMLLPNANNVDGPANILRAQKDYLFKGGFKAIPMTCSYMTLAPGLFSYVFHGVFEIDYEKDKKEILGFDRSIIIGQRDRYLITNDHIYVHMLSY